MNWKKFILFCQALTFCTIWYCGLALAPRSLRAQTNPVYPTDQVMKGKKARIPAADVTGASPQTAAETGAQKAKSAMPAKTASDAEIQAAKASGKVSS